MFVSLTAASYRYGRGSIKFLVEDEEEENPPPAKSKSSCD